jgi:hypothetical protein
MSDIVPGISLDSPLSPLFFWIVITYLIILFYSFGISELKDKIEGLEKLFLAGAVGTVFYLLFEILNQTFIQTIWKWFENLALASHELTFYFNVFLPGTHQAGTTFPEYLLIGILFITVLYIIVVAIFYLLTQIIRFSLDPDNKIFPKYQRFEVIKKYRIKELIYTFPYFLLSSGLLLMLVSVFLVFSEIFHHLDGLHY